MPPDRSLSTRLLHPTMATNGKRRRPAPMSQPRSGPHSQTDTNGWQTLKGTKLTSTAAEPFAITTTNRFAVLEHREYQDKEPPDPGPQILTRLDSEKQGLQVEATNSQGDRQLLHAVSHTRYSQRTGNTPLLKTETTNSKGGRQLLQAVSHTGYSQGTSKTPLLKTETTNPQGGRQLLQAISHTGYSQGTGKAPLFTTTITNPQRGRQLFQAKSNTKDS